MNHPSRGGSGVANLASNLYQIGPQMEQIWDFLTHLGPIWPKLDAKLDIPVVDR